MKEFLKKLLTPTHFKRFLFFFLSDILIITLSLYLSFLIRFDFTIPYRYFTMFRSALHIFLFFKLLSFIVFGLYRITWRYVGLKDIFNIMTAVIFSELFLLVLFWVPLYDILPILLPRNLEGFPRSIFLLDGSISILFLTVFRLSKRIFLEIFKGVRVSKKAKRTIIIGAGNTGEAVLRDIIKTNFEEYYPVAFVDNDRSKLKSYIRGVRVEGTFEDLPYLVKKLGVEALIVAIPSISHLKLREIYDLAKKLGIKTLKVIPRLYGTYKDEIPVKSLEEIKIEDLIGRDEVKVDFDSIRDFLQGKSIMVTGAGGSIGSEIVRQVCNFSPSNLILFEIDETELHSLQLELNEIHPELSDRTYYVVGDIRDLDRLKEVLDAYRPQIVFHAAAYKHVPMMEYNPKEAVKVNIFGTYNVATLSCEYGVEKFIFVSTDKAVRPTSIMGATKRVAEMICTSLNNLCDKTRFISVRFGNVLGSRGSVLPIFLEQLKKGGPITITHKDMERYFMTIPEAVSLVLQASVLGVGGEVMVLDMRKPVKILDLALNLIRLHGLEPYKDIEIEFTGVRPGEKIYEEPLTDQEVANATKHERVFIASCEGVLNKDQLKVLIEEFQKSLSSEQVPYNVRELLKKYVGDYNP